MVMENRGTAGPSGTGLGVVMETAAVVLDVDDVEREAAFWGAVLGEEPGPLRGEGVWLTVGSLDSTTALVLQKVPEPKTVKNRCHMCFTVPDVDEAVRQILALGGNRVNSPAQAAESPWPIRKGTSSALARSAGARTERGLLWSEHA